MIHTATLSLESVSPQNQERIAVRTMIFACTSLFTVAEIFIHMFILKVHYSVGFLGITEEECLLRGCCFAESDTEVSTLLGSSNLPTASMI